MTGLEKIIKQIQDEANDNAAKIIADANAKADEIIAAANAKADEITKEYTEKANKDSDVILHRAESSNALEIKKSILLKKQELIKSAIETTQNSLYNLSDSEYFDVILKIITKYAPKKNGKIMFNQKDLARLPKDFEKAVNKALNADNAALEISDETADIDGGFILTYGGVEENCSFKALFESAADELSDKVHALLFE